MKKRYRNALSNLTASQYQILVDSLLSRLALIDFKITKGDIEGTSTSELCADFKVTRGLCVFLRKCRNAKKKEEENFNPNES